MNVDKYCNFPNRIETKELVIMFQNVLDEYIDEKISKMEFLNIINILTDRQVMSYELLNENIRNKLDNTISDIWNVKNYNEVDIILSIVVNLGLQNYYNKIKESIILHENIDGDILQEINETIEENGNDISNPYRSLEKFN